ncbi:MAG: Com family DNA-binding transcriptional regulator [Comamonas sp.]|nr:Com family DNA-binding transcriptional regulator [Comamonas sp.]
MQDVKCGRCSKLLARAEGTVEIKCPRCGCLNHWRAIEPQTPERPERHPKKENDDAKKPTGMAGRQEPSGGSNHRGDPASPDLLRSLRRRGLGVL